MFETTVQYQARLVDQKKRLSDLESKYQAERAAISARYDAEFSSESNPYQFRLSELSNGMYPVLPESVEFQGYDADQGQLSVTIEGALYTFHVAPSKAKEFYLQKGHIRALESLEGENVELIDPLGKETFQASHAPAKVNPKDGLTYLWISGGSFDMGCASGDGECGWDEKPLHKVSITKGFWLGQATVTQAAWKRVMGTDPSQFKGEDLPVEMVSWEEAKRYCESIGGRLPTEAEWEYAARTGTQASLDMMGNVWQWTADWYALDYYSQQIDVNPLGPLSGERRVVRGGSPYSVPQNVRISYRHRFEPGYRNKYLGLRCVSK